MVKQVRASQLIFRIKTYDPYAHKVARKLLFRLDICVTTKACITPGYLVL